MRIQVNSDKNITVDTRVSSFVKAEVNRKLEHFSDRLTRVEVHLSDENGPKRGTTDKRCIVEARPAGVQPLAVTMSAARVDTAVRGAMSKLRRALETFFGRTDKDRRIVRKRSAKKISAKASEPAKRTAAPKVMAAGAAPMELSGTEFGAGRTSPTRKGIYQARRKSWPKR
jgi:hypothetical protein